MQVKIILFITFIFFLSIPSMAEELKVDIKKIEIESMNIKSLIEKAKGASVEDRKKIENIIKKKIAQAHRAKSHKG